MSALRFWGLRWHRLGLIQTVRCCGDRNWYNRLVVGAYDWVSSENFPVEVLVIDACEPDGCKWQTMGEDTFVDSNSFGRTPGAGELRGVEHNWLRPPDDTGPLRPGRFTKGATYTIQDSGGLVCPNHKAKLYDDCQSRHHRNILHDRLSLE